MKRIWTITLVPAVLALGGCGETMGDRAVSGAGIGAAAGLVGTVITGGNTAAGAVIGGAAGAAAGALTNPRDVNLGKPSWK